jgi:hypothetical protein
VAVGLAITVVPAIIIIFMTTIGAPVNLAGLVVLGISALPGGYFYVLYLRQFNKPPAWSRRVLLSYLALVGVLLLMTVSVSILASLSGLQIYTSFSIVATLSLLAIAMASFAPFLILPALGRSEIALLGDQAGLRISANRAASAAFYALAMTGLGSCWPSLSAPGSPLRPAPGR